MGYGDYSERYKNQPPRICPVCMEERYFLDNDKAYHNKQYYFDENYSYAGEYYTGFEYLWFKCDCGDERLKMIDPRKVDTQKLIDGYKSKKISGSEMISILEETPGGNPCTCR